MDLRSDRSSSVAGAVAVVATLSVLGGCAGEGSTSTRDQPDGVVALSARAVGGTQTGAGPDVLVPAAGCGGDGRYLWEDAGAGDVRSYERTNAGVVDSIVVGAWPMSERAALDALERIDYGASCASDTVTIDGLSGFDFPSRAIEIRTRAVSGGTVRSWAKRAYTWSDGYLVTAWVDRPGAEPSSDQVKALLRDQVEALPSDG